VLSVDRVLGRAATVSEDMPRHWWYLQALIVIFVAAGIVIAIVHLV
jgi:hypothetical protein